MRASLQPLDRLGTPYANEKKLIKLLIYIIENLSSDQNIFVYVFLYPLTENFTVRNELNFKIHLFQYCLVSSIGFYYRGVHRIKHEKGVSPPPSHFLDGKWTFIYHTYGCLFGCSIIAYKPLGRFASNFDWIIW